ncbi:MAG: L,D-transpeptidase family protein [Verrucomicrobiales bacterium]|nr:L,D-transpeptidase family protein [Verrucomicrobiales bacterium]
MISLSQQRAFFYKGQTLVGISNVSTGTDEHRTPTGDYKISQKSKDHESNLYGDYRTPDGQLIQAEVDVTKHPKPPGAVFDGADMPFFMRFNGGIGMHGGILPGYAASHGCVRMPYPMAKIYYENVRTGTPVRVVR